MRLTRWQTVLHNSLGLLEKALPVVDHVLLGVGQILQVDDDDIFEIRHSVVLEQFHLNLKKQKNNVSDQETVIKTKLLL